jgi:hypothetical protein
MLWIGLLILHGLLALLLIGAVTHQAVSAVWRSPGKRKFVESFAAVRPAAYTNAIVIIYLATFFLGGWIYTEYRIDVKPALEDMGSLVAVGLFELKEHVAAIGLGLLPAYWFYWKMVPLSQRLPVRTALTLLLASCVWWNFLVGHVLNNLRGLGT